MYKRKQCQASVCFLELIIAHFFSLWPWREFQIGAQLLPVSPSGGQFRISVLSSVLTTNTFQNQRFLILSFVKDTKNRMYLPSRNVGE